MKVWYKQQILKFVNKINNEQFLKRIYIILRNHMKKED